MKYFQELPLTHKYLLIAWSGLFVRVGVLGVVGVVVVQIMRMTYGEIVCCVYLIAQEVMDVFQRAGDVADVLVCYMKITQSGFNIVVPQ